MVDKETIISCWDISNMKPELNIICCSSCHEDCEDYGYSLCQSYYGNIIICVCCSVASRMTDEIITDIMSKVKNE